MHDSCAFVHGLPTSSSKRVIFFGLPERNCSLKRTRARVVAKSEPPAKPGYYKNPSRAIEKGGGFYIPGLRGPRLRFLVPVVAVVFLAANHASGGTSTDALSRTELLDVIAAMGLLGTALQDVLSDGKNESSKSTGENPMAGVTREEVVTDPPSNSRQDSGEWASDIVQDLEPNVEIAHFRKANMLFRTENVMDATGGPAVERVMREQKGVYIARLSSLPEEVSIPFLRNGDWSVFMVPTSDEDVVVFASRDELGRDSRRWLEALSTQISK